MYWLKIIGIPIIVISVFIGLYRNANPVFDTIISKIEFSYKLIIIIISGIAAYFIVRSSKGVIFKKAETQLM